MIAGVNMNIEFLQSDKKQTSFNLLIDFHLCSLHGLCNCYILYHLFWKVQWGYTLVHRCTG